VSNIIHFPLSERYSFPEIEDMGSFLGPPKLVILHGDLSLGNIVQVDIRMVGAYKGWLSKRLTGIRAAGAHTVNYWTLCGCG
jgi:hypothetical protein